MQFTWEADYFCFVLVHSRQCNGYFNMLVVLLHYSPSQSLTVNLDVTSTTNQLQSRLMHSLPDNYPREPLQIS